MNRNWTIFFILLGFGLGCFATFVIINSVPLFLKQDNVPHPESVYAPNITPPDNTIGEFQFILNEYDMLNPSIKIHEAPDKNLTTIFYRINDDLTFQVLSLAGNTGGKNPIDTADFFVNQGDMYRIFMSPQPYVQCQVEIPITIDGEPDCIPWKYYVVPTELSYLNGNLVKQFDFKDASDTGFKNWIFNLNLQSNSTLKMNYGNPYYKTKVNIPLLKYSKLNIFTKQERFENVGLGNQNTVIPIFFSGQPNTGVALAQIKLESDQMRNKFFNENASWIYIPNLGQIQMKDMDQILKLKSLSQINTFKTDYACGQDFTYDKKELQNSLNKTGLMCSDYVIWKGNITLDGSTMNVATNFTDSSQYVTMTETVYTVDPVQHIHQVSKTFSICAEKCPAEVDP